MNRRIWTPLLIALGVSVPASLAAQQATGTGAPGSPAPEGAPSWSIGGDFTLGGAYPDDATGGCGTQYPYGVGIRAGYGPSSWARIEGEIRWLTATPTDAVCDGDVSTIGQGAHLTPLGLRIAFEPRSDGDSRAGLRATVGAGTLLDRSNPYVSVSAGMRIGSRRDRAALFLEFERMSFRTDLYDQSLDPESGEPVDSNFRTVWTGMNLLRLTVDIPLFGGGA